MKNLLMGFALGLMVYNVVLNVSKDLKISNNVSFKVGDCVREIGTFTIGKITLIMDNGSIELEYTAYNEIKMRAKATKEQQENLIKVKCE